MSKWPMRGHFGHLNFKTFPMTPRKPQCELFWSLLSNSKHSGVLEDSKSPTLGVGVSSSHFTQSGVATYLAYSVKLCSIPPWMWMTFMLGFVFFEFVELSRPLTSSTVLFFPSQHHFLLSLAFYP